MNNHGKQKKWGIRAIGNNSKGTTILEMGFLMAPFVLLLVAVFEFGWYFLQEHTLQYATREGMRLALVGGVLNDAQGNPLSREDSIIQIIQEKAAAVMDIPTQNIKIFQVGNNYSSPSGSETAPNNVGNAADYMRVAVWYDHQFFTPLVGGLFSGDGTIRLEAQGTYRNELFDTGV